MEKIFNNEGYMRTRLEKAKTDRVYYDLPDIIVDESGVQEKGLIRIQTLADFEAYCKNHQIIVSFLMENYPKVVADIYRNAMTELSDPSSETNISKILSGDKVKSNLIYQAAYAPSARSTVRGFLNTFNASRAGVKGTEVELPKFKRTKKQFMKMFEKNSKGYFVPEINSEGLVVSKDGGKFSTNFIALSEEDVTKEQLIEYFKAPFGDIANKMGIDFEDIVELSQQAYSKLGTPDMAEAVNYLVDTCAETYPLSFPVKKVANKQKEIASDDELSDSVREGNLENDENLSLGEYEVVINDTNGDIVEEEPVIEEPVIEEPVIAEPVSKEQEIKEPVVEDNTVNEVLIVGDDNVIKPGVEDGELVVNVTPKEGVVYRYEFVSTSRIKTADGEPVKGSRVKKVLIVTAEEEPSERE